MSFTLAKATVFLLGASLRFVIDEVTLDRDLMDKHNFHSQRTRGEDMGQKGQ